MLPRHAISDADWERIKDLLPGRPGPSGWTAKDNRLFLDAVGWIAKTGAPWRDLPQRLGNWNSVCKRFDRWCRKGTWQQIFQALGDPDLEWLILDSTIVRAHPHAAGAKKSRWQRRPRRPGVGPQPRRMGHQDPRQRERVGIAVAGDPDRWPTSGCEPSGLPDRYRHAYLRGPTVQAVDGQQGTRIMHGLSRLTRESKR